jgi:hypothetical protein
VAGSFKSGRGLSGTGIGALTSIAFTGCKVEGVAVTVTVHTSAANPAPTNLTREFPAGSTVFTGQATNISLTLDGARGCHAVVGAKILSGGGPGFTGLAYRSSDHRLSFAAGGKGLFVQSATAQCDNGAAGLDVKQFDRISLGGFGDSIADSSAIISPAQKISSPSPMPPVGPNVQQSRPPLLLLRARAGSGEIGPRGHVPGRENRRPFGWKFCPERSVVSQSRAAITLRRADPWPATSPVVRRQPAESLLTRRKARPVHDDRAPPGSAPS